MSNQKKTYLCGLIENICPIRFKLCIIIQISRTTLAIQKKAANIYRHTELPNEYTRAYDYKYSVFECRHLSTH